MGDAAISSQDEVVLQAEPLRPAEAATGFDALSLSLDQLPRLGTVKPSKEKIPAPAKLHKSPNWKKMHRKNLKKLLKKLQRKSDGHAAIPHLSKSEDKKLVQRLESGLVKTRNIEEDTHFNADSMAKLRASVQKNREAMHKITALCGDAEACEALKAEEQKRWEETHDALGKALEKPVVRPKLIHLIRNHVRKLMRKRLMRRRPRRRSKMQQTRRRKRK